MKYGVIKDGEFSPREVQLYKPRGYEIPMFGRIGTYDEYVMKEIPRSYGMLEVKDKVVLDIGANIGAFTRWALERGAKKVIAIEPEPNNFAMLELNTTDFSDEQVIRVNAALTAKPQGPMTLYLSNTGKNPGNSSLTPRRGRAEIEVKTIHLEAIMTAHPETTVAKVDCEGAEFELLPELTKYPFEQMAMEYHINGFSTDEVHRTHRLLLADGWVATREPRIQENLWQTLAAYRRHS